MIAERKPRVAQIEQVIRENPGILRVHIAHRMGLDHGAIGGALDQLMRQERIRRERTRTPHPTQPYTSHWGYFAK